jgi:prefoldin subunit 5
MSESDKQREIEELSSRVRELEDQIESLKIDVSSVGSMKMRIAKIIEALAIIADRVPADAGVKLHEIIDEIE